MSIIRLILIVLLSGQVIADINVEQDILTQLSNADQEVLVEQSKTSFIKGFANRAIESSYYSRYSLINREGMIAAVANDIATFFNIEFFNFLTEHSPFDEKNDFQISYRLGLFKSDYKILLQWIQYPSLRLDSEIKERLYDGDKSATQVLAFIMRRIHSMKQAGKSQKEYDELMNAYKDCSDMILPKVNSLIEQKESTIINSRFWSPAYGFLPQQRGEAETYLS